ncbi:polyphosphate polymerase domain-containing protein [Polaribacter vadi]|uniref:polyphosphate polymerase domain-containing protein n=1 Tax=Polaribacter TaxID=52959 RepID=UPI001C09798C|nr:MULTISPECIES: polyphosphate polymerase domain-containing protein [Polaribacter]MBU3009953.1 polyphosphate polymerase domain-containing protein [Polaribacter vadi]MDO6739759.1 polyphosphate polymerase domain-containing protein [Polaribacter sp. 1_MG-2023]
MLKDVEKIIENFKPITLNEMNSVALMKRTDTKFVVNKSQLISILENLKNDYKVLEINSDRIMSYSSLYFDTESNKFYNDHHNGKNNRTKIRQRKYVESDLCFLEIKQKNGKGETNKTRIPVKDFELNLTQDSKKFIANTTHQEYNLEPSLWNAFNRITLVNIKSKERVTLDLNLNYKIKDVEKSFENLVVIEVKQERFNRKSKIVRALKSIHQHPYSISKYCIGMISLYNDLKYNVFKKKLIRINNTIA